MRSPWPLLLGLLVSCSGAEDERNVVDLRGRTFVSQSVVGRTLEPGTEVRLAFGRAGCSATAGCNSISYETCNFYDDVLVVAAMSRTEIGCSAPLNEQDNWLATFLQGRPTTDVAGPRITLLKDGTALAMLDREIASPDRPLLGTQWVGSGIDTGAGMTVVMGAALPTVSFSPDGQFQAFSGCQRASGSAVASPSTISFTALAYDGGICRDSNVEPLSASFLFVLNGMEVTFAIEERLLTIARAGIRLYFTSAQ
jgi:heat shock protein HslJ